jgi:predicted class III extradiol MEMO1 family dioxygenase
MSQNTPGASPTPPVFDPNAPHLARPRLRPVRGFPIQGTDQNGQKVVMLGLADARQISDKMVMTSPAAQGLLPKLDGSRGLDQIVAEVGHGLTRPILEQLVAQLDDAGLLEGPVFEAMHRKMKEEFDAQPTLPPAGTAAFADHLVMQEYGQGATNEQKASEGPRLLRRALDQFIDAALKNAPRPSFDELPRAIVAPHLDYPRGWFNYGAAYGRMRVVDRPDRVVILGTNHFGMSTGVCACDKGYSTPLGVCEADAAVLEGLRRRLGDALFEHRFDHEREHSIELQVAWVQHVFGEGRHRSPAGDRPDRPPTEPGSTFPTVVGILVHDPAVNNGESYDGRGVGLRPFAAALRETLAGLPGRTLIVASADLSHVGPGFGDQVPLAGEEPKTVEFRNRVIRHDQEMLDLVKQNKPAELVAAMAWQQNPTRWCSTGNLVATLLAVEPSEVELLNYGGAMDPQGIQMVTSAAMAMR